MIYIKVIAVSALLGFTSAQLPSYIKPCSRSLPSDQLSECILTQAKTALPNFVKGIPELNLETLDPLLLKDVSAKAGTFFIKSTNVVLKGLRKMEIRDLVWNLQKKSGHLTLFGNLTFVSDYSTEGRVLLIPISGTGKLTVRTYDTEVLIKFKIREVTDENGIEHVETYDLKPSQTFGNVKILMTNILGGSTIGDTVNQVLNDNWRELMKDVGPPFIVAVADKVHEVINKFYRSVPYDQLLLP